MKELVLDISKYDEGIDLAEWKRKRGLWGVIIKVGGNEGGRYKDRVFETHYADAKAAGLHIGFYYYTTVTDVAVANADANHMIQLVGNKEYDLPWYMDVEDSAQFKLSKRKLTDVIKSFCNTLNNKGIYSGLYTGGSAWLNNMYADELRDYANWIAWWRAKWPTEAGDIGMWQQGGMRLSDGNIMFADVIGYHDCDWCCVDYPSRIKSGMSKKPTIETPKPVAENQNGSNVLLGRASDVINAAYGELGYYAPNDPEQGSKYGRWMAKVTGESWMAGPSKSIWWCCMFVSWCLNKGGVVVKGFPSQNTDLALKNGAKSYAVDKKSVQYGDIVIFNWDWNNTTDHIGFATSSFDGVGFSTIEGNVGNAVKEKYRQLGNVAYILRPHYSGYGVITDKVPTVSTTPKNNRDGGELELDGIGGWNTIIDLQHQLGVEETGTIIGQYNSDKVYHKGMSNVTYEKTGSKTVKAIQKKVGADIDGYWGIQTSHKLQEWLISKKYNCGSAGVDGYFGHDSVVALQTALNDGAFK